MSTAQTVRAAKAGQAESVAAKATEDFLASHRDTEDAEVFGITELAADLGLSPRAIRFYEDKGLLSPRRINGGRAYTRRDKVRLMLILRGKDMGMSLAEIKHILDLYGERGEGEVKQIEFILGRLDDAVGMLQARRDSIDLTLVELKLIRAAFAKELRKKRGS